MVQRHGRKGELIRIDARGEDIIRINPGVDI